MKYKFWVPVETETARGTFKRPVCLICRARILWYYSWLLQVDQTQEILWERKGEDERQIKC